jgi:2-polyprenyl-6-methoxyphenol hydroxylase-like FAD-dependent oxidoreductase
MAMAGGYVLANELARHDEHAAAFAAYERALKTAVRSRQKSAARFAPLFVPKRNSWPWLRRLTIKAIFARPIIDLVLLSFGSRSALAGYR